MHTKIRMKADHDIDIPKCLARALDKAEDLVEITDSAVALHINAEEFLHQANDEADDELAAVVALRAATLYARSEQPTGILLALNLYARRYALRLISENRVPEALELLVEAIELTNKALILTNPKTARDLTSQLDLLVGAGIELYSDSVTMDSSVGTEDVVQILSLAATTWGPEFEHIISDLCDTLNSISDMSHSGINNEDRLEVYEEIATRLQLIRQRLLADIARRRGKNRIRLQNIEKLTQAWGGFLQQEIVLLVKLSSENNNHQSQALDLNIVSSQVNQRIGEVERRLRALIVDKYEQQYGENWVRNVEKKHTQMYKFWLRNLERDQSTFKVYEDYDPARIEYARFGDLRELIAAQWYLFREIFDFGYDKKNKEEFTNKMIHIEKVRNPLAHHRFVPENELLRARVFCDDILLALSQKHR